MSFSLSGSKPKVGGYTGEDRARFEVNAWWWRPLWFTACRVAGLDEEMEKTGHRNYEVIEESVALRVADHLEKLLRDQARWERWVQHIRTSFPKPYNECFDREHVERFTAFCRESGGFWIG